MTIDPYTFAKSLAAWMAAQASPAVEYAGTPRGLWIGQAVEGDDCTDPYSVLSVFAADLHPMGQPNVGIQIMTVGEDGAAWAMATNLFNTLLDAGRPRQQQAIEGHKVIAFHLLRPPAMVSRNEESRKVEIASNFDVKFCTVTP